MSTVAVERKKLYQQVWSVPGQQLALLYGISDVGLAKTCKRYDIPRPPRGYWARLAAGQRVRKPPLPNANRGDELVYLKGWDMTDDAVQKLVEESRMSPLSPPSAATELHALAVATREQLLSAKPDHDGLVLAVAPALDIRVSVAMVARAVTLLDALLKRWEARGGTVTTLESAGENNVRTRFAIGPDSYGVRLAENVDESKPLTDPTRLKGNLALYITGDENRQFRRRWSDTKTQRLEKMLGAFVETLANALAVIRQERLDAECVGRQKAKVDAIRKAASRNASHEFYSRQELMQNVDRWHDAQRVRAYLDALKGAVDAEKFKPRDEKQFGLWLEWATQFADSIDPIAAGHLPEGKPPERQNTAIAELDLTAAAKSVITSLGVADTNGLWNQSQETVRNACNGGSGRVWNEITRILEGLHYDVSKREKGSEWW